MSEQETVQKSEYDLELETIEEAYAEKVKADDKFEHLAHKKIPTLAKLLEAEQPDGTKMSIEDIRDQIQKDCKKYWNPKYIDQCLPDKFKRVYDTQTADEDTDSDTLPDTPSDNPEADLIRNLKEELRSEQKTRVQAQKLYDKLNTKFQNQTTEMKEIRDELKEFKKSSKVLKYITPIYDEKLNAIHLTVSGNSNIKLTEYFTDKGQTKPVDSETELVFKLGEKIVLESVE